MSISSTHSILGTGSSSTSKNNLPQASKKVFSFQCKASNNGKILQKEENTPLGKAVYQYSYDRKGHLLAVVRNGKVIERYEYNHEGQRVEDYRVSFGGGRQFIYGHNGTLIRVNDSYLDWTPQGQLKAIYSQNERIEYEYGNDTRLDKVFLPSGDVVQYEYGNELMPVRVLVGYDPVLEYVWKNHLQLQRCVDIQNEVTYLFSYGNGRTPESVTIQGQPHAIQRLTGQFSPSLKLRIWTDQIGSIRALSTNNGAVIKYLEYDAFGNITLNTKSEWSFPLGFAGGLNDFYTGFVRFGFRDYDPQVGRFTAKDPIGDTGGDHDLWDYCVDDPIGVLDFTGLIGKKLPGPLGRNFFTEMIFPDELNIYEQRSDIKRAIRESVEARNKGTDTDKSNEKLWDARRREKDFREKYGDLYDFDVLQSEIDKIIQKINEQTATEEDKQRLWELRRREQKLLKEHGENLPKIIQDMKKFE